MAYNAIQNSSLGYLQDTRPADVFLLSFIAALNFFIQDSCYHIRYKTQLGTTPILQKAIEKGSIDLYPEYTGTAYMVILHQSKPLSPNHLFNFVNHQYQHLYHLRWITPLGFSNSETLAIPQQTSRRLGISTLSQLKPYAATMTLAVPAEFFKRPDGLKGLQKVYQLEFKHIVTMEPSLMYRAIANHQADVIESFTTDGWLQALHLTPLKDDKHFYPPYQAAIVIRQKTLRTHPRLFEILQGLRNSISEISMQKMNYQVDVQHQSPNAVAKHFLATHAHSLTR